MSKRTSHSTRRAPSLTLPQEIALLSDVSIQLLLEQYHLVFTGSRPEQIKQLSAALFPTDRATTTTTEPTAALSTKVTTETCLPWPRNQQHITRDCDPVSSTSISSCHVSSYSSHAHPFKIQVRLFLLHHKGGPYPNAESQLWEPEQRPQPKLSLIIKVSITTQTTV